jgi:hypothetical protein
MFGMGGMSRRRALEQHCCAHQDPHDENRFSPYTSGESTHKLNRLSPVLASSEATRE